MAGFGIVVLPLIFAMARIDLAKNSLPYALTLALDNCIYWLPIKDIRTVKVIDTKTRKYIASTKLGNKPERVPILKTTTSYVASWFDDTASLIDISKLATIKTIKVGKALAPADKTHYPLI